MPNEFNVLALLIVRCLFDETNVIFYADTYALLGEYVLEEARSRSIDWLTSEHLRAVLID